MVWYGMVRYVLYPANPPPLPASTLRLRILLVLSPLRLLQQLLPALATHDLARAQERRDGVERRVIVVWGRREGVAQL